MKIPSRCPLCNASLRVGAIIRSCHNTQLHWANHFMVYVNDSIIEEVGIIINNIKLSIFPLDKIIKLYDISNFEIIATIPIIDIDISSKEDITNKFNLITTFI